MAKPGKSSGTKRKAAAKAAPALKRPPEVTRAEWAKWSPAYRKRAVGFYAKHPGAPRYQMRGKGKGEHLTLAQRREARIEALAERQAYRGGKHGARDADEIADSYRALVAAKGWSAFNTMERVIFNRQKGDGRITADDLGFEWSEFDGDDAELFYN